MTAGVGFKFTVHFSTLFSTTRTSFRQNGTLLSCRRSDVATLGFDQLHNVSKRLAGLAKQHQPVSESLITIAGSVRNTATILAVLVATRSPKPI
jgi:hypothetical protein